MRYVDNDADALFLEPIRSDGCGGRNVILMVASVYLNCRIEDLAAKILHRHSCGFNGALAAEILVQPGHVGQDADVYGALLRMTIDSPKATQGGGREQRHQPASHK